MIPFISGQFLLSIAQPALNSAGLNYLQLSEFPSAIIWFDFWQKHLRGKEHFLVERYDTLNGRLSLPRCCNTPLLGMETSFPLQAFQKKFENE